LSTNLGFPRIGSHRELKKALEGYWSGASTEQELLNVAAALRARHWFVQQKAGIDHVPSNDFSFYDQVLDTIAMLGAVPDRFGHKGGAVPLELYFGMARGTPGAPAMEMTKWFDTNYHYIVPELTADTPFALCGSKALDEFNEAKFLGLHTRPVLIGPVTFLKIAKMRDGTDRWALLPRLLPTYLKLLAALAQAGAALGAGGAGAGPGPGSTSGGAGIGGCCSGVAGNGLPAGADQDIWRVRLHGPDHGRDAAPRSVRRPRESSIGQRVRRADLRIRSARPGCIRGSEYVHGGSRVFSRRKPLLESRFHGYGGKVDVSESRIPRTPTDRRDRR